jgi:hypothetical protein
VKKWSQVLAIILIVIFLGYIRDFIFVNLNWNIKFLSGTAKKNYMHSFFVPFGFQNWSVKSLIVLKWALTFSWVAVSALLSHWAVKVFYPNKSYLVKLVWGFYALICAVALPIYFLGATFFPNTNYYHLVRGMMGAAQGPLPGIIILFGQRISMEKNLNKQD